MNAEANSGACREYEGRLEDYLAGQLAGADAKQIADHLGRCGACRGAVEEAARAVRLLGVMEPTPDPGPGFARIAMARINGEIAAQEGKGFWQPFVALAWRFAATVTVVLALGLSYEAAREHWAPRQTTVAQARLNDMRYMFSAEQDRVPASRDDVLIMVAEAKNGNR
ncbi:MAG TPA: zf-HC2 domain-containing protein [Candidatus Acidoferrum sp.]|nr:zf-HC2 domain-containing protein [Candidatus Acidoferrum sp.]